jgi:hypothetical protein
MLRVSESMWLRHSLQIVDPIYHVSQPFAPYGLGTSLALLPLVAAGDLLLHVPRALLIVYLPLVTTLTAVLVQALALELGASQRRAFWLALAYSFATPAWHYAGVLFSEPLLGLCMAAAFLGLLRLRRTRDLRWAAIAGAAMGASVLTREDSIALVVLPMAVFVASILVRERALHVRHRLLALTCLALPVAMASLCSLLYDLLRYGRVLGGPYANDPQGFSTPLVKGIYGLTFSPGAGLFVFCPLLLVGIGLLPSFARRWGMEAALICVLVGVRLLFFAGWWDWAGGATWGPRYLVPLIPLLLLPLATLRGRPWLAALLVFATLSLAIELLVQFVPYGLYYGLVVPELAARLGICHCVPIPGPDSLRVDDLIHFDPRYSALVVQANLFLRGVFAPVWRPLLPLLCLLIPVGAFLLWRLDRLATLVDAHELSAKEVRHRSVA